MNFTQETFDSYVKENIDELDMSPEEAVEDAIETAKLQGGNLYFIIKKNVESDGRHLVLHLLDALLDQPDQDNLTKFVAECETFECRHWACMAGCAFNSLSEKAEKSLENKNLTEANIFIAALAALLKGQPDWVNFPMVMVVKKACDAWLGDIENNYDLITNISNLVLAMSKMHEQNRADMMIEGIQPTLCRVFEPRDQHEKSGAAIAAACGALQAQIVDDDNRKAGSDAHGRAKAFVTEHKLLENGIELTRKLLKENQTQTVNQMLALITSSLVCADFCKQATELGAGELAVDYMRHSADDPIKVKFSLNLIKNMIGNDDVRHKLITTVNIHEDVVHALQRHFAKVNTALAALRCITSLTLRNPECARTLVNDQNAAEAIVNALNCHSKNKAATRAGLMAARNCVVRASELRPKFLQLGLETIANEALQNHGLDEAKACLRDLGCDVALKEIWAGTGHKLKHADNTVLTEMNIT